MSAARECGTKIRHATKTDALAHAFNLRRRFAALRRDSNVYSCRHCGCWHVGHRAQTKRRTRHA